MKSNLVKTMIFLFLILFLNACGSANFKQGITSNDLNQYTNAYIAEIGINSKEQNENSLQVNERMREYAQQQLEELISNC